MSEQATETTVDRNAVVSLREITLETVRMILNLKVAHSQEQFVAPNAVSIAEAYFVKEAWFRAIYADETPVGFVMLHDNPAEQAYFLWRFMIDARYQSLGFGRRAIEQLVEYVKMRPGATELRVSCVPGDGSPCPFYEKLGFQSTGEEHHGELVLRLPL
ncbi:MAG: GNAT family N-acetyltransferase [Caldilineaceae bacterium]